MYFDHYGDETKPAIVFLHGAFFVHPFGRQYPLAEKYFLTVPHLPGYGKEADRTFRADEVLRELREFITALDRKVILIGFSLGAQLAVQLTADHPDLFNGAIFVSPWLIKDETTLGKAFTANRKQWKTLQHPFAARIIGLMNGLPKAQRKAFAEQMQHVSEETLKHSVYTGITLDSVNHFTSVTVPTIALAGAEEPPEMVESVRQLQAMNANCHAEIWKKAAHNIPPLFHQGFNRLIDDFVEQHSG